MSEDAVRRSLLDMAQAIASQVGSVPSPCLSVCQMDAHTGLCQGCWRSLDEIAAWGRASNDERRAVWQRIAHRLSAPSGTAKGCC
jgi:predicted Fe-S protein YdhL (DUF1289 family)